MTAPADHDGPHFSWIGEVVCGSDEYAVIRISLDGTIEGWWGAAKRLFGYAPSEAVGQPFAMLFTAADREKGLHEVELELARQAGRSEDDRWHLRKDGARFWGNGVVNPVHDAHGRHIAYSKLMRDRTDLRIRYEALQNRLHHLAEQMTRGQEALGTLVHELRNPLAPMVNAARVIESDAGEDIKRRMIRVVARQAEVMRQVLDEAGRNPTANSEPLHVQSVVLQEALRTSVDALLFDAGAKGVDLALVCPATPVSIEVDPARLQQMLMNLLTNAIKYTSTGGHVTTSLSIEGDMAVVRVDDDGDGIAPENLERVFELFTREENHEAVPGMGVGLAVVKRLAWLHHGFVEARSPGKGLGSQFTLQLPLSFDGSATASDPAVPPAR
jgi:PAS domain S-box-containing protein